MASNQPDRRGPKIGDAASLWNFTPSPGWTKEEVHILRLCLMKFGVGQWVQILATGLLPGKLIQQLNGQTQRLLGQQSLAAFTGLRVDVDRVRIDNDAKTDVQRKSGLIIWSGPNPTKDMRAQWQLEAKEKYGLSEAELKEAEAQLEEIESHFASTSGTAAGDGTGVNAEHVAQAQALDLMDADVADLPRQVTLALLARLRSKLLAMTKRMLQHRPDLAHLVPPEALQEAAEPGGGDAGGGNADLKENRPAAVNRAMAASAAAARPAGRVSSSARASSSGSGRGGTSKAQGGVRKGGKNPKPKSGGSNNNSSGGAGSSVAAEARRAAMEADISQIMEMGFSRSKAKDALQEAEGSLEGAITFLLMACS